MDELTLEEKKELLTELKRARYSGASRVRYLDREVTYKSDAEMLKAINDLNDEINDAQGSRKRKNVRLASFSSGL